MAPNFVLCLIVGVSMAVTVHSLKCFVKEGEKKANVSATEEPCSTNSSRCLSLEYEYEDTKQSFANRSCYDPNDSKETGCFNRSMIASKFPTLETLLKGQGKNHNLTNVQLGVCKDDLCEDPCNESVKYTINLFAITTSLIVTITFMYGPS